MDDVRELVAPLNVTATNTDVPEHVHTDSAELLEAKTIIARLKELLINQDDDLTDTDEIMQDIDSISNKVELILEHKGCDLSQKYGVETYPEIEDIDDNASVWEALDIDADYINENEEDDVDDVSVASSVTLASTAPAINTATLPLTATPAKFEIKYAPAVPPVKGTVEVCAISLQWLNKPAIPVSKMQGAARQFASIYQSHSGGLLHFNVTSKVVRVNFDFKASNLRKAEKQAKAIVDAAKKQGKYNLYIIVNHGVKGYSNAGGNTAHLYGTLTRDWLHEVGHILPPVGLTVKRPTGLGHAGRYIKGKLEAYGDGTDFMSSKATTGLNAPHLYYLGWLAQNKVAQHDAESPAMEYKIENISSKKPSSNLKAVLFPREGRDVFLSTVTIDQQNMLALHYQSGGGTQRIKVFNKQAEFEGLLFDRVSVGNGFATIRVSPKPQL